MSRGKGSWRRLRSWVLVGLLAGAILAPAAQAAAGNLQDQIHDAQQKQNQIQNQIQQKKGQLNQTKKQKKSVQNELKQLDAQITATQDRLNDLNAEIDDMTQQISETSADLQAEETLLAHRQQELNDRLRLMYEAGHVSYLEVLLSARSFSDLVERWTLLEQIADNNHQLMVATAQARDQVAAMKQDLEDKKSTLLAKRDQVTQTKTQLAVQVSAKQNKMVQLEHDAKAYEAALNELEASSQQVEQMLTHLQLEYARQSGKFALQYPLVLRNGHRYRITSPFGRRYHPILHVYRMHTGDDIGAPMGTKILAAESGKVVYAGWLGGYGNATIIDHGVVKGHSIATLYGHQSKILVSVGQIVKAGQVIGRVGMTGLATGPHLHFEVRVDGTPVNPMKYINLNP